MLRAFNRGAARTLAALIGFAATITFLSSQSFLALIFVFFGPTLVIVIHELGHAFAAWRFGLEVREISIGPLAVRFSPFRFGISEEVLGYDVGGYVLIQESSKRHLTSRIDLWVTAAGPLANLISVLVGYGAARYFDDSPIAYLFMGFALVSLAAFILSAWPFRLASGRKNDAMQIVQILSGGALFKRRKPPRSRWQAP